MGFIGQLIVIELVGFGTLTLLGVVVGLVQRQSELVLPEMIVHRMSPARASMLVAQYLESVEDYRFGFPTGRFGCQKADPDQVIAIERAAGTLGFSIIRVVMVIPLRLTAGFARVGCCAGAFLGFFFGLWLDLLLLPGVLIATAAEAILKNVLQSKITVNIVADVDESVRLQFRLAGPSARLLRGAISEAFLPATIPDRIGAMAGIAPAVPAHSAPNGQVVTPDGDAPARVPDVS